MCTVLIYSTLSGNPADTLLIFLCYSYGTSLWGMFPMGDRDCYGYHFQQTM